VEQEWRRRGGGILTEDLAKERGGGHGAMEHAHTGHMATGASPLGERVPMLEHTGASRWGRRRRHWRTPPPVQAYWDSACEHQSRRGRECGHRSRSEMGGEARRWLSRSLAKTLAPVLARGMAMCKARRWMVGGRAQHGGGTAQMRRRRDGRSSARSETLATVEM
jgi:hypothetical protein